MGGSGDKVPGQYMGWWGSIGSQPQKGVVSYSLSGNRQNPMKGAYHAAVFNVFRRTRNQVLYWAPALMVGYYTMQWATERNEYLNSKEGRALYGDSM